ncbi:rho GTPase-activating protein 18 isoform X5 [Pezoporus wallicus]|uniref:rho GTPase-activating protein 18 isoform X5 n=1 Tax=Pezoporus wallicus TaxID=35540 RepID=UPI00255166BF|nr:rho GTPase-activating protein 18 isoform X5 [Pezoporus wallicus]XP_061330976.1 rho GTPase-activating protein 18 isoform X5 [Pezoporus flaviventris]
MSWRSGSRGVVLTAYHPSGGDGGGDRPGGRRSGQYTMNHDHSKTPDGASFDRSGSQDSLDELSMDDYWKELENIHETRGNNHEERVALVVKEPDEGELEEEWLKEAGLSNLFGESSGDPLESMVFLSTLTRTQRAAVEKRVETVTQTMRKKNKHHQIPDVRDIFRLQNDSKGKVCDGNEPSTMRTSETKNEMQDGTEGPKFSLGTDEQKSSLEDMPSSDTDINLEISFSEQAANFKDSSVGKMCKGGGRDTLLPNFRVPKDKTGTTKIGDLAPQDMKKVYSLALIELTALYDILGTEFKQQKAVKIKTKECGLFGVPLSVLLEQDQKKVPGTKIPLIFQKLIAQIEEATLETEGLLRIPGVATRIKNLCQELEAKFYEGTFNWENVKQHDAASLLKLFIRELPQPLLTVEYLKAFQDVQKLPTKKQQLQALNLLVLLLPEANRDTLKVLLEFLQRVIDHREKNKMTLKNVAMVMAPNLFTFHGFSSKTIEQSEFVMAAGTANVMRFMIQYQKLLWTADVPQGVIRVQAPHLSKVSMAIQLTEELKAGDIVARFLSQKSGNVQTLKKEEVFLYEIGGNIGERCLDDDTYMKDLYQLNPNAEWVIKPKQS